eukprot:TRINITY_DN2490_c0_g2_i2.p1 TRINITY_DN2490_c0_g2~~TRINITY_DN2490_c0_g2_i2.p1  ORF type:complete len:185 (-),score=5.64 TRINITY_DN2490_c0_g2_i2:84-638(-)
MYAMKYVVYQFVILINTKRFKRYVEKENLKLRIKIRRQQKLTSDFQIIILTQLLTSVLYDLTLSHIKKRLFYQTTNMQKFPVQLFQNKSVQGIGMCYERVVNSDEIDHFIKLEEGRADCSLLKNVRQRKNKIQIEIYCQYGRDDCRKSANDVSVEPVDKSGKKRLGKMSTGESIRVLKKIYFRN